MRDWSGKRYWLVGASQGLGRAEAHELSKKGVEVILSARDTEALEALASEIPGKSSVVPVDVSDAESVASAAKAAGEIDGLFIRVSGLTGRQWLWRVKSRDHVAGGDALCGSAHQWRRRSTDQSWFHKDTPNGKERLYDAVHHGA